MAHPQFTSDFGKVLDIGQDGKPLENAGDADLKAIFSTPGELAQRTKVITFPGIGGELHMDFGVTGRDIVWHGVMWGQDHGTLNLIDKDIEDLIKNGHTGTMTDQQGRSIKNCKVVRYRRSDVREKSGSGFVQPFAIVFRELTP